MRFHYRRGTPVGEHMRRPNSQVLALYRRRRGIAHRLNTQTRRVLESGAYTAFVPTAGFPEFGAAQHDTVYLVQDPSSSEYERRVGTEIEDTLSHEEMHRTLKRIGEGAASNRLDRIRVETKRTLLDNKTTPLEHQSARARRARFDLSAGV